MGRKDSSGGKKNSKDLFIEGRRSGRRVDASEFLIIATATSHLATAYTMAAVAVATAWSLSDSAAAAAVGREEGNVEGVDSGQPGRQVDRWSDGERSARWRAGWGEMARAEEEEEEQV